MMCFSSTPIGEGIRDQKGSRGGRGREQTSLRAVLHFHSREADVVWRLPQHLSESGDSVLQLRGWVQPASAQDARATQVGLQAGRSQAPAGEAHGGLPHVYVPRSAALLLAPGARGEPPPPPAAEEAPRAPPELVD